MPAPGRWKYGLTLVPCKSCAYQGGTQYNCQRCNDFGELWLTYDLKYIRVTELTDYLERQPSQVLESIALAVGA